jgi:hypothetical protein
MAGSKHMNVTFEEVWADFRHRLKPGSAIKNWSVRGYTGREFRIDGIDGAKVVVIPAKGKPRSVSKADFAGMYSLWSTYKSGTIGRAELTAKSQNTTYILSLFHWRESLKY